MYIPKKRRECVRKTNFEVYISLVSVVYKAMCLIVQERLVKVVEEKQLLAEEQCGFSRGRGCREQILTLALVGQP